MSFHPEPLGTLPDDLATALRRLEEIGGWVQAEELAYQLDTDAPFAAYELVERGLVESQTFFSLTDAGREALKPPPPAPDAEMLTCQDCGSEFPRLPRGRRPLRCPDCRPFDRRRQPVRGGDSA